MGGMLSRLMDTLFTRKLEVVLVGLENSGKTTLLNVMASGVAGGRYSALPKLVTQKL